MAWLFITAGRLRVFASRYQNEGLGWRDKWIVIILNGLRSAELPIFSRVQRNAFGYGSQPTGTAGRGATKSKAPATTAQAKRALVEALDYVFGGDFAGVAVGVVFGIAGDNGEGAPGNRGDFGEGDRAEQGAGGAVKVDAPNF